MYKLYWQVDSNADLSCTCATIEECMDMMTSDFESLDTPDRAQAQYTFTPVWMTQEEYDSMEDI